MGFVVVIDTTVDVGMDMVAFTIEDVGVEIVAPVTLVTISLIISFMAGGLTISGSNFALLKRIY
jgi:hypothetical protein